MIEMFTNYKRSGANFSPCRKYRYALWRVWDETKPLVMFIGLNPSTANETTPDNTIKSVTRISKAQGYGGFYMMNCFPFVSTIPEDLIIEDNNIFNDSYLKEISSVCKDVIFAWGAFDIVKSKGRDKELHKMFPNAKALIINKDGSPRHPLYVKGTVPLVIFQ